jgi:squalene-hopene/tetraprenyl-beta-curcumene cyclase
LWQCDADGHRGPRSVGGLIDRIPAVTERGLAWLAKQERDDGSFSASSFGSEHHADGQNPVYGAASVILACAQLGRVESEMLQRAVGWLIRAQHVGGGWGPPRPPLDYSGEFRSGGSHTGRASEALAELCTVEETAWAVTAMLSMSEIKPACAAAAAKGLNWLAGAIEQDRHRRPAMVGVWPRKLWYDERLYPLCYATAALSRAVRRLASQKAAAVLNA